MNQDGQSLLLVHVFANTRAQMIATKTHVLTPYCVRTPVLPRFTSLRNAHQIPTNTLSTFYLTSYCLHLPEGICGRLTVGLHQYRLSAIHCTRPVRHFSRAKRESDAHSLFDLHQRNPLLQSVTGF